MTRIEYIRLSHRHTNRKIRERLQAVRTRLDAKADGSAVHGRQSHGYCTA